MIYTQEEDTKMRPRMCKRKRVFVCVCVCTRASVCAPVCAVFVGVVYAGMHK